MQSAVRMSVILALMFIMILPAGLTAQTQSGNIRGTVTSGGDGVLPGVTVTLTPLDGGAGRQTFVTDATGEFRFLGLHPGTYSVGAELSGFGTVTRNVDVVLGRSAEINIPLSPATSQAITVTAATPVIDTRDTGTGVNIESMELQAVPSARDPWVMLQSVPGVLVDRVNIGGNESGQQSYFIGKGVERHQTEWNLDGVAITDMAATGTSSMYFDFDSFEEIQVATGGSDPSVRTPGVHLNMVTKRGTNDFKGSGRFFMTDKQFQAEATVPAEAVSYFPAGGNSINHIDDYGLEAGGPLMRDKLWAWGALSSNRIENFSAGNATLQRTRLKNANAKINYQPFSNNNAEAFFSWNDKTVAGRGLGTRRQTLDVAHNQSGPGYLLKLEDTHSFSQSLYLTGSYAQMENGYKLDPIGGRNVDAWWDEADGWHRTYSYYEQNTPQKNARVDGSAYVGSGLKHELKFGFGYRDTPVESATVWPGNGNYGNFYDGYALAALTRPARPNFGSRYVDAYLGDTLTFSNLTVTGGLRYDIQRAKNFGGAVEANPVVPDLLPAATFAGDERALEWKGISPRLGATYAIGNDRRTVVRGSYSRYMDQLGSSDVGASNPFYRVQMLYYYWEDLNGDKTVQRNELDFGEGLYSFENIDPNNPSAPYSAGRIDYDMKPPRTDEFIIGAEREIAANFAVGVSYSYRYRTNFVTDRYEKTRGSNNFYTAADYVRASTANITGTLPDGTAYSVPNYRLRAGTPAPTFYVTTNRPDYHQTYNGIELTATKRFSNRWMMRGNVTLSDWKQHVGENGFVDPTPLVSGDSCSNCDDAIVASSGGIGGYINSRWSYSLNSAVELPFGIMAGAAIVGREGYVVPYFRRQNNRDGLGNKNVMVSEEFGSNRLPNLFNLDLRLGKDFQVASGFVLNLAIDLFNVTNERTVLWRDNRMYSAVGTNLALNNNIEQLQSPRVWRAGARIRF